MMATKIRSSSQYVNQWIVTSETDPTKEYKVSQKEDGSFACSCPRWIFGKPRVDCKHINGIKHNEPIDHAKTAPKAAENFVRFAGKDTQAGPVFLKQTKRHIIIVD